MLNKLKGLKLLDIENGADYIEITFEGNLVINISIDDLDNYLKTEVLEKVVTYKKLGEL